MEIYTTGGGDIIYEVLRAITLCLNGGGGLMTAFFRIGGLVGVFIAYYMILYGNILEVLKKWGIPVLLIMNLFFLPKTKVLINDTISGRFISLDNVPYGLAVIASQTSRIGKALTDMLEQNFSDLDDLRYNRTGMVFGSNILSQAKKFSIEDRDLKENFRNFVGQCVKYDIMLNGKYTFDQLMNSPNIWQLVSEAPSRCRGFFWQNEDSRVNRQFVTCSDAVRKIDSKLSIEIKNSYRFWGKKLFSGRFSEHWGIGGSDNIIDKDKMSMSASNEDMLRDGFKSALHSSASYLANVAQNSKEIMRQILIINSINNSSRDNIFFSGKLSDYAVARATVGMMSTFDTVGRLVANMLPIVQAVFQAVIYACFIFIIPLCMIPNGYKFLMNWCFSLVWVQTWGPLYAILNFIMNIAAKAATVSEVGATSGFTMNNIIGVANANSQITLIAGYLSMSIPFIGFAIVRGVSGLVSLSGQVLGASSQTASLVARETSTGNFSFGNISLNNVNTDNMSKMQYDYSSYLSVGGHVLDTGTVQAKNDAIYGRGIINREIGSGAMSLSSSISQYQQRNSDYQRNKQLIKASEDRLSKGKSYQESAVLLLAENLSNMTAKDISDTYNVSTEKAEQVYQAANVVWNRGHGVNYDEQIKSNIDVTGSGGGSIATTSGKKSKRSSKGIGLNFGASLGLGMSSNATNSENFISTNQASDSVTIDESKKKLESFAQTISSSSKHDETTQIARDLSRIMQQNENEEKSIAEHKSIVNSMDEVFSQSLSEGINENFNLREKVIDLAMNDRYSRREAENMIESQDPRIKVWIDKAMSSYKSSAISVEDLHKKNSLKEEVGEFFPDEGKDWSTKWKEDRSIMKNSLDKNRSVLEKDYNSGAKFAINPNIETNHLNQAEDKKATNETFKGSFMETLLKDNSFEGDDNFTLKFTKDLNIEVNQINQVEKGNDKSLENIKQNIDSVVTNFPNDLKNKKEKMREIKKEITDSVKNRSKTSAFATTIKRPFKVIVQKTPTENKVEDLLDKDNNDQNKKES